MIRGSFNCKVFIDASREKVEEVTAEPPALHRYQVTDRLTTGSFHIKIKYRADVIMLSRDEAHTEAWQKPGVHIISHMYFVEEDHGTQFREDYTIEAPNLLFAYTFKQAKMAHEELLVRIKQVAEAPDLIFD